MTYHHLQFPTNYVNLGIYKSHLVEGNSKQVCSEEYSTLIILLSQRFWALIGTPFPFFFQTFYFHRCACLCSAAKLGTPSISSNNTFNLSVSPLLSSHDTRITHFLHQTCAYGTFQHGFLGDIPSPFHIHPFFKLLRQPLSLEPL